MMLEFLGLKPQAAYYVRDLESALITHLQEFLLELGNGFTFVSRQQRILLEDDEFYVDLVFYNRLLRCFVLFELKRGKLNRGETSRCRQAGTKGAARQSPGGGWRAETQESCHTSRQPLTPRRPMGTRRRCQAMLSHQGRSHHPNHRDRAGRRNDRERANHRH